MKFILMAFVTAGFIGKFLVFTTAVHRWVRSQSIAPASKVTTRTTKTSQPRNAANVPIIFAAAQSGFKNDTAADECSNTNAPSSLPKTYFIFSRQMLLPYVAAKSDFSFS